MEPHLPGSKFSRSFGSEASRYALMRPPYPAAAVDFVLAETPEPLRILDLGAGTGKLTASLIGRAAEVCAVEPDDEMRALLTEHVPLARAMAGSAEHIPLPDASVDAIVAGQAFHWFARPAADREMARVLRPGGVVGLIWNFPDRAVEWVPKLYQLTRDRSGPWSSEHADLDPALFQDAEQDWTSWDYELPGAAGLLDLVHTWSWVITRTPQEQRAIDDRFAVLVSRHAELQGPVVRLRQRTKSVRQYRR